MNPFLGARPYGPSEDRLFFGRTAAAQRLSEQIELHELTILTSPSGLGKTSLLRAAVLPSLEESGLSPIYLRADPIAAPGQDLDAAAALLDGRLDSAIVQVLIPDPKLEIEAIQTISEIAPVDLTIGNARKWFKTSEVRGTLLTSPDGALERLSTFARYLRGTVALSALAQQAALVGSGEAASLFVPETRISELSRRFPRDTYTRALERARQTLREPLPSERETGSKASGAGDLERLIALLARLSGASEERTHLVARPDGDTSLTVRVVFVIDQFEQLFTLGRPDTRRRVFALLAGLINAQAPSHFVLSLRKEWYADLVQQLAPHLRMAEPLSKITHYLEPMTRKEATEVMQNAPLIVSAPAFSLDQQRAIWDYLQADDSMDAVVLSIACHEYFASKASGSSDITESGIEQLFSAYLSRALSVFADEAERDEAIDVLGEVAGTESTRGFVTHSKLLNAPLRDPALRINVLDVLQKAFLVKGDSFGRMREKVYDIMHERLLVPVRQLVDGRPAVAVFREAAYAVTHQDAVDLGLSWQHCRTLLSTHRRIAWDSRSAGILISSTLRELTADRLADLQRPANMADIVESASLTVDDRLRERLREVAEACALPVQSALISVIDRLRISWWMTAHEIRAQITARPDRLADELALRSCVQGPAGWMRSELAELALRLSGTGSRSSPGETNG